MVSDDIMEKIFSFRVFASRFDGEGVVRRTFAISFPSSSASRWLLCFVYIRTSRIVEARKLKYIRKYHL